MSIVLKAVTIDNCLHLFNLGPLAVCHYGMAKS